MGVDMHPLFAIKSQNVTQHEFTFHREELPESGGIRSGEAVFTIETKDGVEAYLMDLTFTVEGAEHLLIEVTLTDGTELSYDVSLYFNLILFITSHSINALLTLLIW